MQTAHRNLPQMPPRRPPFHILVVSAGDSVARSALGPDSRNWLIDVATEPLHAIACVRAARPTAILFEPTATEAEGKKVSVNGILISTATSLSLCSQEKYINTID